ncbi:MAG: hypothetical protein H6658_20820 [Ardenticatenaceae bacterium]|nr:hypothetical protein [Ardenticatenaceae bacterium]
MPMRWRFHHLTIEGRSNDPTLTQSWQTSFASLATSTAVPDLICTLDVVDHIPALPPGDPHFQQGDLLYYYVHGGQITAHFPRYGQVHLDLDKGTSEGRVVTAVLDSYGVLEDLLAISLSPHLRRRGLFLIHAFAAAYEHKAVLLVGGIGAGKTTTGMSLLNVGWQLLSNDSPIVSLQDSIPTILSYPGVLAAYPDTFSRFSTTQHISKMAANKHGHQKRIVPPHDIWPDVWLDTAPIAAIFFPHIEDRAAHALTWLSPPQALTRLLPHAVEQWDTAVMPQHLSLLRHLVEHAPAYELQLGPDVSTIPALLQTRLNKGIN